MNLGCRLLLCSFCASAEIESALDSALAAYHVRNNWQDGFNIYATMMMYDTTGLCDTLEKCVQGMNMYFEKILMDDKARVLVSVDLEV